MAFLPFLLLLAQVLLVHGEFNCGETRTCFFQPNDCLGLDSENCAVGAVFEYDPAVDPHWMDITLSTVLGDVDGVPAGLNQSNFGVFVAVGFSHDVWMGDDTVIFCVSNPNISQPPVHYMAYNKGKSPEMIKSFQEYLTLTNFTMQDGEMQCRFHVKIKTNDSQVFPLDQPYHLLLTRGVAKGSQAIIHSMLTGPSFPFVSDQKVQVASTEKKNARGGHPWIDRTIGYNLMKAHGAMMMLGFWFFLFGGVIFGRFYKFVWGDDAKIGSQTAWFLLHRIFNVTGVLLIFAGYTCIWVSTGHLADWEPTLRTHMILGITATAIVALQVVFALCRPHPSSEQRPLFRDLHFFLALAALAIASGTIVLSYDFHKAKLASESKFALHLMYSVIGTIGLSSLLMNILSRLHVARSAWRLNPLPDEPGKQQLGRIEFKRTTSPVLLHLVTFVSLGGVLALVIYLIYLVVTPVHTMKSMLGVD